MSEKLAGAEALGWLARAGLVARGAVYFVIGLLALELALGVGGKATDQEGAMKAIAAQPFGKVLLVLLAIGLAGYALWRLTRAAVGHGAEQTRQRRRPRCCAGQRHRLRALLRAGGGDPRRVRRQLELAEGNDRRRARLVGRDPCSSRSPDWPSSASRSTRPTRGIAQEVPRRREDGEMSAGVRKAYTAHRRLRPGGAIGRLRARSATG